MSRITVHMDNHKYEYSFTSGCDLLSFLRSNGYSVSAPCGGNGKCGKCRVMLRRGGRSEEVIACKTVLNEDCEVFLVSDSSDISWNKVSSAVRAEGQERGLGAAIDLGTTTVAVSLYELESGRALGSLSRWNAQKSFGADVISRIGHCMDGGLPELCQLIREQIYDMMVELCRSADRPVSDIKTGFLAGNTVMEHIFAGISPDSIASAPYLPSSYFDSGEMIGLHGIPIHLSPCIAGYVGGDITAGILASGLHLSDEKVLFIDVGTNGEIVLGDKDGCFCCAVASGPAFEGAGISCGMPAGDGAISSFEIDGDELSYQVIGGGKPRGICGSGLLDLAACLLDTGYIDDGGCLEDDDGESVFYITEDVYIDRNDIRQLQLAKAAVSAGITRLTEMAGIELEDIGSVYLSGGFGTRLRGESAIRIGLLPAETAGKVKPIGNTSLTGAAMALVSRDERSRLTGIKQKCRYLELSSDARFNTLFVDAMSFPEL